MSRNLRSPDDGESHPPSDRTADRYAAINSALVAFLRTINCPLDEAEDIANDAVGAWWIKNPGTLPPFEWVRKRAIWIRLKRLRARRREILTDNFLYIPAHHEDRDELIVQVQDAAMKLPIHMQRILVRRFVKDLPLRAIAKQLGCSEGTIRRQLVEAYQKMMPDLLDLVPS